MPSKPVLKRLVLFFPGFEPLNSDAHYHRFVRGAQETAKVWDTAIRTGPLECSGYLGTFAIESDGAITQFVICDLLPVMQTLSSRNFASRIASGLMAQACFILNGTFFAYLRTSWRYGLFFLYPLLMLAAMLATAWIGYGMGGPVAALGLFSLLLWLACRHAHFLLMMDLWAYAAVLANDRPHAATDALIGQAEQHVLDQASADRFDEIVISGHSIGAALVIELAGRLSHRKITTPVHVLTLGSGLLQIALHPNAARRRETSRQLLAAGVYWLDVQALIDPINFLHSNLDRKLEVAAPNYRELIIRMRHLLSDATYRRVKFNFFRVHRQFVLPVERKQRYSFHRIVSGSAAFPDTVRAGGLPETISNKVN